MGLLWTGQRASANLHRATKSAPGNPASERLDHPWANGCHGSCMQASKGEVPQLLASTALADKGPSLEDSSTQESGRQLKAGGGEEKTDSFS